MKLPIILFLIFNTSIAAFAQPVVGGTSSPAEMEFFVAIGDPTIQQISPLCGGTLIDSQWVLTAAHCVLNPMNDNQVMDDLTVYVNLYSWIKPNQGYEEINADKIYMHPGFGGSGWGDDIALIHLSHASNYIPIGLPGVSDTMLDLAGTKAILLGHGIQDTADYSKFTDSLQMAQIEIIDFDACNTNYTGRLPKTVLCAGVKSGSSKGSAFGDSGGPLFITDQGKKVQIGVVSGGEKDYTTAEYPGIYVRVSDYRHWIDSTINSYNILNHIPKTQEPLYNFLQKENTLITGFNDPGKVEYRIYSFDGKLQQMNLLNVVPGERYEIDVSQLEGAYYFILFINEKGDKSQRKFCHCLF